MKDLIITIDVYLFARLEKLAREKGVSIDSFLASFFDSLGCPNP